MGPGSFDPGNRTGGRPSRWPSTRFNGAGVFRPRKSGDKAVKNYAKEASMGPGSFDPGNIVCFGECSVMQLLQWGRGLSTPEMWPLQRITTATSPLQWGRGLSTPEMRLLLPMPGITLPRFNGAGVFRPRKCGQRRPRRSGRRRFNGAGVFRPRKWVDPRHSRRLALASMGPGSFDPGNMRLRSRSSAPRSSFNGAGVFRPRKCDAAKAVLDARRGLQWGRGLSTPEMARFGAPPAFPRPASMGPGSFDPGNSLAIAGALSGAVASMGPGSFDPGNLPPCRITGRAGWSFNGAGVFRPRK